MDAPGCAAVGRRLLKGLFFRPAANDQQVGVFNGFGNPGKGMDENNVDARSKIAA